MPMTIDATQVLIGAATSFQVDGTEYGPTTGGVAVELKRTFKDIEVDQYIGPIGQKADKEEFTVKTKLAAGVLANLKLAWEMPTAISSGATSTLQLGTNTNVPTHALTFIGPGPNGSVRTFTIRKAVTMSTGAMEMSKDKTWDVPVEFKCLIDPTQAAGSEYGSIADAGGTLNPAV